jgi:antitoxin component YwqK of YwqJK toxin-antitoxin module
MQNMAEKKSIGKSVINYHTDGTIWSKGKIISDQPDGYWEWFRKDGVIMRSGYFNKGKRTGKWTTYDKQGKVYKVTQIKKAK